MHKLLNKYRNASPALRTSIWFAICNYLQRGAALIVVPIFTRLLTTQQYGICNIYFAWFDIFILFTSLKLPYEGLNNGLIRHEEDKDGYASAMLGLIAVLTCGCGLVYLLFRDRIDRFTGLSGLLMAVMFLQLLFQPALMLWTNRERFDFRYRLPVIVTLISTVINPVIAIIAVLNTRYMAEARIISLALVQVFFGLICAAVLLRRGKRLFHKEYWRFALGFNLPLLAYYLSQSLLNQSDRIMINYFDGSGKAAIYSVAYSAATLMQLAVSAINGAFNPWMYRKLKAGAHRDVAAVAAQLCVLICGATLAMTMFAPDLVAILATEEYRQAIWIIPPVSASVFFIFVYMMFANVEMYFGENKGISVISILCTMVNVVLNGIFIPRFGYLAAGWTTLASYLLLAALHYILMKRACRIHRITGEIFPARLLLAICAVVIGLTFAAMGLYTLGWVRYAVITLEAVLVFLFRRKLLALFKHIKKGA